MRHIDYTKNIGRCKNPAQPPICEKCGACGDVRRVPEKMTGLPTSALIAELEKRRPCDRCARIKEEKEPVECIFCRWNPENIEREDNFKEAVK